MPRLYQPSRRAPSRQAPDGVWICNGTVCGPGTVITAMSTAAFVRSLY